MIQLFDNTSDVQFILYIILIIKTTAVTAYALAFKPL